jgi:hypothetical protein
MIQSQCFTRFDIASNSAISLQQLAVERVRQDYGEYDVCKVAEDLDFEAVDLHILADPLKSIISRDW